MIEVRSAGGRVVDSRAALEDCCRSITSFLTTSRQKFDSEKAKQLHWKFIHDPNRLQMADMLRRRRFTCSKLSGIRRTESTSKDVRAAPAEPLKLSKF